MTRECSPIDQSEDQPGYQRSGNVDHQGAPGKARPHPALNPAPDQIATRYTQCSTKRHQEDIYLVTEMVCEAAGGPQRYSGRSMGDSHRHLMISEGEWQAFLDDFQQTLDKFAVPQPEQKDLIALVESTKEAIVVAPF